VGYSRLDGRYESKKFSQTHSRLGWVGPRTVFNARLGVRNDWLEGSLWVGNLFNNKTPLLANTALTLSDFLRLPISNLPELRTFGASITAKY